MNNISKVRDCYGCGICVIICPQKIIKLILNSEGFYEPLITESNKCTNCGLCCSICSFCNAGLSLKKRQITSYAAWSKDDIIRKKCTSGGVSFELGRHLINQGYEVCGVRYNAEKERAEHYIATTIEELIHSIGSKYIQSYTIDGFNKIDKNQKYLVTGTPCQIDSFRRYIQKFHKENNFILLDFFCHGVPSMLLWHKYITEARKKVGKITYASWRNKHKGWHDSYVMRIQGETHIEMANLHDSNNSLIQEEECSLESRFSQGDGFYNMFFCDFCLGKACYEHCKYKYDNSSSDIRIGDLWGKAYKKNEDGVSAAIAFTEKGKYWLTQSNIELIPHSFNLVAEGQMKKSPKNSKQRRMIIDLLKQPDTSIKEICDKQKPYVRLKKFFHYIKHPFKAIQSVITKLL